MAAESSTVNGAYNGQYNQPAELAATTPSHAPSASQSSTSQQQQKADPQEIGWYFVEQYYTNLSKTPERIHLFYSKKSQLVTGLEAEKVVPAIGSKAISEKIKALDIQDCKVRVLNVDSQSSFDNIVVQVIGEMSNRSQPHHKFVQTFVLATQPNGYFVLNDIFRYLNDDEDEIVEDEPVQEPAPAEESPIVNDAPTPPQKETVTTKEAVEAVDEKLEAAAEPTVIEQHTNGIEPEAVEETAVSASEPAVPQPVTIPLAEQPQEPEPTPVSETPKTLDAPAALPAKKTWASLVGTGAKAQAVPALPTSTAPAQTQAKVQRPTQPSPSSKAHAAQTAPTPAQAPAPISTPESAPAPAAQDEWQMADNKKHKGNQNKAPEGNVYAYIKNVTEKIDARELKRVLEQYGELKYYDVSRPRNCAFVEFATPGGYVAAVAANPHTVNDEIINVEERRPRPGTFTNQTANRGGINAARGRGSLGRGNFPPRGTKSGTSTPRGRGQAQAA